MAKKERPRTTVVEEAQVVAEVPVTSQEVGGAAGGADSAIPRPPVRERARTAVYPRAPVSAQGPEGAPPKEAHDPPPERVLGRAAYRALVEHCPLALFQMDGFGNLLWANEPFAEFARQPREALLGRPIHETRLGVVYPAIQDDVRRMAGQSSPPIVKQVVTFEDAAGVMVSWQCWLAAETNPFGDVLRVLGYLHPYGVAPE